MKKFLCMMMAVLMVLAMAACGGGTEPPADNTPVACLLYTSPSPRD